MICGEQGSGKTVALCAKLLDLKKKYPKCLIRTNMNYLNQDDEIIHWKQLVDNDNGIYGQVEVLDEIQTWFSSLQSKDFPAEMITEISQQRKQRKNVTRHSTNIFKDSKTDPRANHFCIFANDIFRMPYYSTCVETTVF